MSEGAVMHGTPKSYRAGCRCDECKQAWRDYVKTLPSHQPKAHRITEQP